MSPSPLLVCRISTSRVQWHPIIPTKIHFRQVLLTIYLVKSRWSLSGEQSLGLLDSVWQWELQVLGQELLDVLSLDVFGLLQLNNLQDVDRSKSGSVSSSQVLVHGLDGTNSGNVSVFLVHVVDTRSGVVSNPDTEVLDLGWVGLGDDVNGNDLTGCSLDLVQFL